MILFKQNAAQTIEAVRGMTATDWGITGSGPRAEAAASKMNISLINSARLGQSRAATVETVSEMMNRLSHLGANEEPVHAVLTTVLDTIYEEGSD